MAPNPGLASMTSRSSSSNYGATNLQSSPSLSRNRRSACYVLLECACCTTLSLAFTQLLGFNSHYSLRWRATIIAAMLALTVLLGACFLYTGHRLSSGKSHVFIMPWRHYLMESAILLASYASSLLGAIFAHLATKYPVSTIGETLAFIISWVFCRKRFDDGRKGKGSVVNQITLANAEVVGLHSNEILPTDARFAPPMHTCEGG